MGRVKQSGEIFFLREADEAEWEAMFERMWVNGCPLK
jgi:hypothetical protein